MAETKDTAVKPHAVMSEEEASALQRQIILNGNNPAYRLPDGRTVAEVREAQAAQDEKDRAEAASFERKSLEANTPRVEKVAVRVEEGGNVVATAVEVKAAATQLPAEEGATPPEAEAELSEDFPARAALAEAGYTKRSQLAVLTDEELTAVSGIGPATAAKIREALG